MFNSNGILKVITYRDEDTNENRVCFVYEDGSDKDVSQKEGELFLLQYLKEIKGYTKKDLRNGKIAKDETLALQKTKQEMEEIRENVIVEHLMKEKSKEVVFQPVSQAVSSVQKPIQIKNFPISTTKIEEKVQEKTGIKIHKFRFSKNLKRLAAIASALAITAGAIAGCGGSKEKESNPTTLVETQESKTEDEPTMIIYSDEDQKQVVDFVQEDQNLGIWKKVMDKANQLQKKFMSSSIIGARYFNKTFADKHEEKNVILKDGHQEEVVRFGLSPEEYASAYILGSNFDVDSYKNFMNASDISIREYKGYYESWYMQMYHAYAVRTSKESTGLIQTASSSEGNKFLSTVEKYHKQLRAGREEENQEKQQQAFDKLYELKNSALKLDEAVKLDPTYENFQSLALPDYVLLATPVFDEVANEYRDWTTTDGHHFRDERDEKVFGEDGIYCHLYEWTMAENVAAQEAKLSDITYVADESYADYDALIAAITEKEASLGILKDSEHKEKYAVENLEAVSKAFNWESIQKEVSETIEMSGGISGGSSGYSSTESTRTETSSRTEKKEEKITEEQMSKEEKKEAEKQKQQIEDKIKKENEQAKQEADKKADEEAKKDQAIEDAKKEQLEKDVINENQQTEEKLENMKPGDGAENGITIEKEHQDENGNLDNSVSNITTDDSGLNESFPDLNGDGSNVPVEVPKDPIIPNSDQSDTIVEWEEEIPVVVSQENATQQETSSQAISEPIVSGVEVPVEGSDAIVTYSYHEPEPVANDLQVEYQEISLSPEQVEAYAVEAVEMMANVQETAESAKVIQK